MAPTASGPFTVTIPEDNDATGTLVNAGAAVGDASAGVSANDGDNLTYSLDADGDAVFDIDSSSGAITVGDAITNDAPGGTVNADGDVVYNFYVKVSDGITANNLYISATVTVDVNSPVELVGDAADGTYAKAVTVNAADNMPQGLVDLQALVSDADGNPVTFEVSGNPSHIVHSVEDMLLLTYLPTEPQDDPTVSTFKVSASDSWNDDPDDPDATIESRFR